MTGKRKVFNFLFILTSIVLTIIFVPWQILRFWINPLPETIQEQMDFATQHGLDGMIVYVQQSENPPQLYASGWNNRENHIPANPNDLFKIASISKLYIAAATVKLIAEQRLSLDQTLAEYIPDLKDRIEYADRITLKNLIQHRSGIPNYSDHPDYPWDHPYKDNRQSLALILGKPAEFEPDQDYQYSNTNYLLIGEILDHTLGYSHHQYIKDKILTPLNLHHTYSLLSEVELDEVMSGYFVGYGPDIKYNDFVAPGGSMVATISDVGQFIRALNTGTLLNENEQEIYSSVYTYEHTGLLPGYSSIARYLREMDTVVIQFVNTSGGKTWSLTEINYNRIIKILEKNR